MDRRKLMLSFALAMPAMGLTKAWAKSGPAVETPLTEENRRAVIAALATQLRQRYVFPDVADKIASALQSEITAGTYAQVLTPRDFASQLTQDLQRIGQDRHLRVDFDPTFTVASTTTAPTPQAIADDRANVAQHGFGIASVQRLPGNIGFLDVRGFFPTEFAAPAISGAFALLAGSAAIILDLRHNHGGEPETVAFLLSHVFPAGDERHLNDLYDRTTGETRTYWTTSAVTERFTGPLYVLISSETFSAGEECAYDLQTQKRATLIGETTGGGANPGEVFSLVDGFVAFIPTGRAINPVTHANWEHVGVSPDIATTAMDALMTAYITALQAEAASAHNAADAERLANVIVRAKHGEISLPSYTPQR